MTVCIQMFGSLALSKYLGRNGLLIDVCVPELVSNDTRQDETGRQFPNWRDRDKITSLRSRCSGKFGKNLGRDGTIQYHSGKVLNGLEITEFSRNFKFGNSGFIFGTETGRDETGPGRGCSQMLGTGNSGSREMAFGNANPLGLGQTSALQIKTRSA